MNSKVLIVITLIGVIGTLVGINLVKNARASTPGGPGNWQAATSGSITVFNNDRVLASTSQRVNAIICNDSVNTVYLNADQDKPATANKGIRLNANGGCWEIGAGDFVYWGAVRATSSANSVLTVIEYVFR